MSTITYEVEPSHVAAVGGGGGAAPAKQRRLGFGFVGAGKGKRLGFGAGDVVVRGNTLAQLFTDHVVPHLRRRGAGTMQIFVRAVTAGPLAVEVNPWDTVGKVKAKIQAKGGIPAAQQRLMFAGRHLEDSRTLAEYGIKKEANLHSPSASAAEALPAAAAMRVRLTPAAGVTGRPPSASSSPWFPSPWR